MACKKDELTNADAMVILMGSLADRILVAMDIYNQGKAGKLIIVEENMDASNLLKSRGIRIISNTEQAYNAIVSLGVPSDSIKILPGGATSTQVEAIIVRDYLNTNFTIDSLIIVSSSFHTRRASMIFKAALNKAEKPVYFICCPSIYTSFNAQKWWKGKEGIQTVMMEYLKIINFIIFEKGKLK